MLFRRFIYLVAFLTGIAIMIYFYLFNFENMSETELVDSVLYWYVPLLFGVYGLSAIYWKKRHMEPVSDTEKGSMFTDDGKEVVNRAARRIPFQVGCVGVIFTVLTGAVGFLFLIIPLSMFKKERDNYDMLVSSVGTLLCMAALAFFFVAIWPSL